jgi:hypothetical protein
MKIKEATYLLSLVICAALEIELHAQHISVKSQLQKDSRPKILVSL